MEGRDGEMNLRRNGLMDVSGSFTELAGPDNAVSYSGLR